MDDLSFPPVANVFETEDKVLTFEQLTKLFDLHREYIKVEHGLQHERMSWHLAIQGFLFAFLGVIGEWPLGSSLAFERKYLPYLLALAGILVAIVSWVSVRAAEIALTNLYGHWRREIRNKRGRYADLLSLIPSISGGGEKIERDDSETKDGEEKEPLAQTLGKVELLWIPRIIICAWLLVIAMFSFDKQTPTQEVKGPCSVRVSDSDLSKLQQRDVAAAAICSMEDSELYAHDLEKRFRRAVTDHTVDSVAPTNSITATAATARGQQNPKKDLGQFHATK